MELIDKSALVAEIKRRRDFIYKRNPLLINSKYCIEEDNAILDFLNTLEVKEVDFPCDENRDKELALSLQIQAYLNTASDELYAKGKPLYSKSHLEGIHECMKMWAKLHDYYFYKNSCKNKEVDVEKEIETHLKECLDVKFPTTDIELIKKDVTYTAKKFFELGIKMTRDKIMTQDEERLFEEEVWDYHITENTTEYEIAKHFFELGLKVQKGENV